MLKQFTLFFSTFLAALHFNNNSGRLQARTMEGLLRWKVSYPKARDGEAVLGPLLEEPTYGILNDFRKTFSSAFIQNLPSRLRRPPHGRNVPTC